MTRESGRRYEIILSMNLDFVEALTFMKKNETYSPLEVCNIIFNES